MGHNRQQKADSALISSPLADNGQTSAPKRARNEDANPVAYNKFLANNQFAFLPVDQVLQKAKVVPLFAATTDITALRSELAAHNFKLCHTKVMCDSRHDYDKTGKLLKSKEVEFCTHDAPGSKPLKVPFRGLPEYTPEAIIDEMKATGLKPTNLFPIQRVQGGRHRNSLCLVRLEKGSITMAGLMKVRASHCGKCAGAHATTTCQPMEEGIEPCWKYIIMCKIK